MEAYDFSTGVPVIVIGVFLGAFVAGFAGFGLSAAAGAFLLHVLEPKVAIPLMMICSVCAQCAGLVYLRKTIGIGTALPFVAGGIVGVPVAVMILRHIDGSALRTGFGVFLIAYSSWALLNLYSTTRQRAITRIAGAAAVKTERIRPVSMTRQAATRDKALVGMCAGLVGGLTAMPGALLSIWADARKLPKAEQRGFVQPFILSIQLLALALMFVTPGLLTREVLAPLTVSVVPLAVGTLLGLYLYGRASAAGFRLGVLAILFASGCGLVSR